MKTLLSIISIVLLLAGVQLLAQTETGQVTGTITDPSGAAVANARINLTSTGTGVARTVTSSGDGGFNITNLLPGEYMISVSSPGFTEAQRR